MKEAQQILFDRYLSGSFSSTEKTDFESRLKSDGGLREEFELYQEMNVFLEDKKEKGSALEVLREVGRDDWNKAQRLKKNNLALFVIPFLFVALGIAWFGYNKAQKTKRHRILLAEYEYPPNKGTRSLEIASTKLDSAIHYFDLRRMEESEKLFLEILAEDSMHQEGNRYMGHISFLKNKHKLSSNYLKKINRPSYEDSLILKLIDR